MKVENATFYQAVRLGQKLEHFLTTAAGNIHPGLEMKYADACIYIKANIMEHIKVVPLANVKEFHIAKAVEKSEVEVKAKAK